MLQSWGSKGASSKNVSTTGDACARAGSRPGCGAARAHADKCTQSAQARLLREWRAAGPGPWQARNPQRSRVAAHHAKPRAALRPGNAADAHFGETAKRTQRRKGHALQCFAHEPAREHAASCPGCGAARADADKCTQSAQARLRREWCAAGPGPWQARNAATIPGRSASREAACLRCARETPLTRILAKRRNEPNAGKVTRCNALRMSLPAIMQFVSRMRCSASALRANGAPLVRDRGKLGMRNDPGSAAHHAKLRAALRPGKLLTRILAKRTQRGKGHALQCFAHEPARDHAASCPGCGAARAPFARVVRRWSGTVASSECGTIPGRSASREAACCVAPGKRR